MKKAYLAIIAVIILVVGWYLASPLFLDKTVDEQVITQEINQELNTLQKGQFQDADDFHKVSGSATIIEKEGKKYLVLENFQSTNGPDLKVYLSSDKQANDYLSLGELKGNIGNQQYEIPLDTKEYQYALIWCEAFSVLFGSAELQ